MSPKSGGGVSRLSRLGYLNTRRTRMPVRKRIRSRGVPTALTDHEVFCTESTATAADLVSKVFGPTNIHCPSGDGPDFQAAFHAIRVRGITLGHLDFHTAVQLDTSRTEDHYLVHMPTNGKLQCLYDGGRLDVATYQALLVNRGVNLRLTMGDDVPLLMVRIEREALERTVSRMLGRSLAEPVRFEPVMNLTADEAVRWHGALQLLSSEVVSENSLLKQGLGAGPIEELLISSLVLIQPSNVRDDLVRTSRRSGRRSVQRSVDYIERNLASPITLADIAKHTNMSARSIQQGFRDDLGTTPMAYVRDRRLERVRNTLFDAIPEDNVTVTDVAERWGFTHLGNFAVAYRKRFGESPSETLRS